MKRPDGSWYGISIQLWQMLARDLGLTYTFKEMDLLGLLNGMRDGTLDAAVAALTMTAEREEQMDFTHPFYTTGLGIAVPRTHKGSLFQNLRRVFSVQFIQALAGLLLVLFIFGVLVWLSERKRNPAHFGGSVSQGLWSGFWWAAVTMTTVGYGDKAPISIRGRILALIWMFAGIITISSFTASITAALTITQLASPINGPEDLAHVRTATIPGSTSAEYLRKHHLLSKPYGTPLEGLQAVAAGDIDAMVYDAPLLRYLAIQSLQGAVTVLPFTFERQDYGIALRTNSPLRELMNRAILRHLKLPAWQTLLQQYTGR
jgi:ABC-type amino acid transport substrate-binding protein